MLTSIIPAHNEERWIGNCLGSIHAAMKNIGGAATGVIVVDDASTDATAKIASELNARTLRVELRLIAAVRNAGVRVATGDILFFIDADTQANEPAIRAVPARSPERRRWWWVCAPEFVDPRPVWARIIIWFAVKLARRIHLVGGCFQFCTRDAFDAIGGYNENLCAGEDMAFCQAVKKVGRFVVPGPTVITSARKLKVVSPWEVISLLVTILIRGPKYESRWIIDILYGDRALKLASKPMTQT